MSFTMTHTGIKKKVTDLAKMQEHARETLQTRLVQESQDIKDLDKHIKVFLDQIHQDAQEHDPEELKSHVKEFESLIHSELDYLFKVTEQDLKLYLRILESLSSFRSEMRKLLKDKELSSLAESEINYADLLGKSALEKLETLQLLFKKMK